MATTSIHAITQTIDKAVEYITADKNESYIRENILPTVRYHVDSQSGSVTYKTLVGTLYCTNPGNPSEDLEKFAHYYGRDSIANGNLQSKNGKPILAWHLVQSFDREINPIIANEIGLKLAEQIFGFCPVVVATHTNTENTHNHILASAWNYNGKKWHNCHATYQEIRTQSDKLCEEYGLNVIDKTRNQVLVKWTDKDGNIRYFEPTARKDNLRRSRKDGKISPDDVGSYRNTFAYEIADKWKQTNREIVRQAIEAELPFTATYEELLQRLRTQGYSIKCKKKGGQWLENITFTPPGAKSGVRDSSLGEEYCRKQLTTRIRQQTERRNQSAILQEKLKLPLREDYGIENILPLNEDYRAYRDAGGFVQVAKRQMAEKPLVQELKQLGIELYGIMDTTRVQQLVLQQRTKKKKLPSTREEELVSRIQVSFENLRFLEEHNIGSDQEILEKIRQMRMQITEVERKLAQAGRIIEKNPDWERAEEFRERMELLQETLSEKKAELGRYERCVAVLERIKMSRPIQTNMKKKLPKEHER